MGHSEPNALNSLAGNLSADDQPATYKGVQFCLRELLCFRLRVIELVSSQATAVEPTNENVGISRTLFGQRDRWIRGWIHTIDRVGLKHGIHHRMVRIKDLNHIPEVVVVHSLEDVGPRRQDPTR